MSKFFLALLLWCYSCKQDALFPVPRYQETSVYHAIYTGQQIECIGTIYLGDGRWYPVYTLLTLEI